VGGWVVSRCFGGWVGAFLAAPMGGWFLDAPVGESYHYRRVADHGVGDRACGGQNFEVGP
jgi:hypothetical protein